MIYLQERYYGIRLGDCLGTTDEKIAEIRRREIHIALERGEYQNRKKQFADVVEDFLEAATKGKASSTKVTYKNAFRLHVTPWFGAALLGDIRQGDLLEYKRFRESEGAGQYALTLEMWLFRKLMKSKGVTIELLGDEPFLNPGKVIDRFATEPEVLSIIAHTNGTPKSVFLVMAYSGLRKTDCLSLKWSAVDFHDGFIKHTQQKTGKLAKIPIHEKLADALALEPRGVGNALVFRISKTYLGDCWSRARKKAGLEWVRIHDLRHFYASFLASNGVRREVIGEILGHKDTRSTARYAKFDDKTLHDAGSVFVRKVSANLKQREE